MAWVACSKAPLVACYADSIMHESSPQNNESRFGQNGDTEMDLIFFKEAKQLTGCVQIQMTL